MNKNDCLKELKNHQWLKAEKKVQHNITTWVIQLGAKIMKQSQFDILFNMLNQLNQKVDDGFKEVNHRLDHLELDVGELKQDVSVLKSDMKEVKTILKKHDKALFKHGLINEESF